jgi:5'-phosphate synthase pdxT subunit
MIIGILALQGAFIEHKTILDKLTIENILVKKKEDVELCDGIILPGGESTVMSILENDIFPAIRKHIEQGKAVWGTCAGLILIANDVEGKIEGQQNIGGLNIKIKRNHFGSQMNSFVQQMNCPKQFYYNNDVNNINTFDAVFIRAPIITEVGPNVEVLNTLEHGTIVAVKQTNIIGTCFHPELISNNYVWHSYFINMISNQLTHTFA